jgi:uncharacterized protein YcgL (UPF0745 family)
MFIKNKYSAIYFQIIQKSKIRTISGYFEKHHVVPKCFGGDNTNKNIVKLTAKEHFICHRLLPKMTEGEQKYKMLCAIFRMMHNNQKERYVPNARTYESVVKQKAKLHSLLFSGKNNPFYGKRHSIETKNLLRKKRAEQVKKQGTTMPIESRLKLSIAAKGRKQSAEHVAKKIASYKLSEEGRQKIILARLGRSPSEETRKKLSIACRKAYYSRKGLLMPA